MVFLGLDIGTSGTKALLLSERGKVLGTAEAGHTVQSPRVGWSEQDPEEWWGAARKALRQVIVKAGVRASQIKGIGLSGQMHGAVFLDGGGKVLRPALLWNDQRTGKQCAEIEGIAGGRTKLVEMVGNPALTGFTAPKILWVRENEPGVFKRVRHVLLPKDYIRYRLTGELATDLSDASGTLLLNVRERQWHEGLISLLGLDLRMLPRVVESQAVTGTVMGKEAKMLGLGEGVLVAGGGGDQAMGAVGAGVVKAGVVSAAMGTSGVIFATSVGFQTDPRGRVHTMCHAVPGMWCTFGCMLSAGGSLQYMRNLLYEKELRGLKDAGSLYAGMIREAAKAPAGAENLFFLPYLTGERCPHADANATGCFVGLTPRHNMSYVLRAVLEGITFGMREQVAIFREMGVAVTEVRATGGGARSRFWRQMQADMYDSPVATINVAEGAALGAAIVGAVAAGGYGSIPEACGELIRLKDVVKPDRKKVAFYGGQYRKYAGLYPALAGMFSVIKGL